MDFFAALDAAPDFAERFHIVGVNRLDFDEEDGKVPDSAAARTTFFVGAIFAVSALVMQSALFQIALHSNGIAMIASNSTS